MQEVEIGVINTLICTRNGTLVTCVLYLHSLPLVCVYWSQI